MFKRSRAAAAAHRITASLRSWRGTWLVFAALVAVIPVVGMFSNSRVFIVRDLVMYYWPKHRWLRDTILSGQWPWWDPYMAGGQNAAADALVQMFFLPTLLLRLVLPEVLGFNLWVGLPYPLAAIGTYLFARCHLSRQASALTAIVFAASGPFLGSGNFPNVSWSAMAIPWVLWATDRSVREPGGRSLIVLASCMAAQILAGEPVTMTATVGLAGAYAVCRLHERQDPWSISLRSLSLVIVAIAAGAALSAIQLVPLARAAARSPRSVIVPEYFWSLHPASLVESIAPFLFGDNFQWGYSSFPWMRAIGSGRDPFFFSMYCGVGVYVLALAGLLGARRRWALFWTATLLVTTVFALGAYTRIYPALQDAIWLFRTFRYPPKFFLLSIFALAMLAGHGWQALKAAAEERAPLPWRVRAPTIAATALLAIAGYAATLMALLYRGALIDIIYRAAVVVGVPDVPTAVTTMLALAEPHGRRLMLLAAATAFLIWIASAGRRESRLACAVLFATVCADLVITNGNLNPALPVAYVQRPEWVRLVQDHPDQRFYFGGRLRGWFDDHDIDAPKRVTMPAWANAVETRTIMQGIATVVPSQWRVREALSFDLPLLFPLDYDLLVQRFEAATHEERRRFLVAAGVRDCVMTAPPFVGAPVLTQIPALHQVMMYECAPAATRVQVVPPWGVVEPNRLKRIDFLFRPEFDVRRMVVLDQDPPAAAGRPGPPVAAPYARFTRDDATEVVVATGIGRDGGFLVLMDSYDPDWHAEVDGQPAALVEANAVYRAVRLVPGEHTVRFRYRPDAVVTGAVVSGATLIGLCAIGLFARRAQPLRVPAPLQSSASLDDISARSAQV